MWGGRDTTISRDMGRKTERSRHNVAQRYTDGGFSARAAIGFHMQHVQFHPSKSERETTTAPLGLQKNHRDGRFAAPRSSIWA